MGQVLVQLSFRDSYASNKKEEHDEENLLELVKGPHRFL